MGRELWFKAKRYGWGWTPCSIKGWVITLIYIIGFVIAEFYFILAFNKEISRITIFGIFTVLWISPLIWICYKKGEKPGWRWG